MPDHWYDRSGLPCYEQPMQKGGLRATDLRDARKLGLVPSVTTVLSVVAKPALERWKVNQGILAALTLAREPGEPDEQFLARVTKDSQEQARKAAEEGTRIHDEIEKSFKGQIVSPAYRPHVEATHAKLAEMFPGVTDWVAEASFASPLGYGGKVDLHSPSTGIVVDFKGKDGDFTDCKQLAYDQHWQLVAYREGLPIPGGNVCGNIFVSRTHPGAVSGHIWGTSDLIEGWSVFRAALALWKACKRFDPSF